MERCLDPKLWYACAGGMVRIPPINSKVFYFPQGHAEHADGPVNFGNSPSFPPLPPLVLCRLTAIKYLADPETDEVFAKIVLQPLKVQRLDLEDDWPTDHGGVESPEKAASFPKTLTQSDANNGGGFSVPRYCAETIFPRLDYNAEPPLQIITARDVHGKCWKFRHIYRGTPRRHLLTTGWSDFVNHKKLVAGDSIVFLRAENGDMYVGIRRAKRCGFGGGMEYGSGWNSSSGPFGGFSMFLKGDGNNNPMPQVSDNSGAGRVTADSVVRAATLAASGQPFEVVYYPRAGTPEFFVKASSVSHSMRIQWCPGMRFKMPFETEDLTRISWFMGTISSVQVADPIRWPNSPWRLLQVAWDEPDLLQNVKQVSPWLVELAPTMPSIHLSEFSSPRKKLRGSSCPDFSLIEQLQLPSNFPSNHPLVMGLPKSPLCYVPDNIIPAGIQGARHAQYGLSPSDVSLKFQSSGLFPTKSQNHLGSHLCAPPPTQFNHGSNTKTDDISRLLTMATPASHFNDSTEKKSGSARSPHIMLFGKIILTEHQNPENSLSRQPKSTAEEDNFRSRSEDSDDLVTQLGLGVETGHCKVFMESEDVGRTLDLSVLGSYEELYATGTLLRCLGSRARRC